MMSYSSRSKRCSPLMVDVVQYVFWDISINLFVPLMHLYWSHFLFLFRWKSFSFKQWPPEPHSCSLHCKQTHCQLWFCPKVLEHSKVKKQVLVDQKKTLQLCINLVFPVQFLSHLISVPDLFKCLQPLKRPHPLPDSNHWSVCPSDLHGHTHWPHLASWVDLIYMHLTLHIIRWISIPSVCSFYLFVFGLLVFLLHIRLIGQPLSSYLKA